MRGKPFAVAIVLTAVALAGCSQDGNVPEIEGPYTDPITTGPDGTPTARPGPTDGQGSGTGTDNATGDGGDGDGTDAPTPRTTPPLELKINVTPHGPAPADVNFTFDIVSEHREDEHRIFFYWRADFRGDGTWDVVGDSNDFLLRDENHTVQRGEGGEALYAPHNITWHYPHAGVYNVTLAAYRDLAYGNELASTTTKVTLLPAPTFDELCPTSPADRVGGNQYLAEDGTVWSEANGHAGLQRSDTSPDCPSPDVLQF